MSDQALLYAEITAHDRMGARLTESPNSTFVSDWNGDHPFVNQLLGDFAGTSVREMGSLTSYSHLDEDEVLAERLLLLHRDSYGDDVEGHAGFVPGAGATAFLFTLLQHQHQLGTRQISYLPPVYYNAAWWIRALGWDVNRVADNVDFARRDGEVLDLPPTRGVLWLTDPVWFAGRPVRAETIEQIAAWQTRTGSTVIVDGTFQYLRHNHAPVELTRCLDPTLTYRLICPTKTLGLHGFRFAYTIVPRSAAVAFAELHGRSHGAAGLADRAFAHHAVDVLSDPSRRALIPDYAAERIDQLRRAGVFEQMIEPETGYFVFGRPKNPGDMIGMDQSCFGAHDMAGHLRFNVLNRPAIETLMRSHGSW